MIIINNKNYLVWGGVVVVAFLLGYFLVQGQTKPPESMMKKETLTVTTPVPTAMETGTMESGMMKKETGVSRKIVVSGDEYSFSPSSIAIQAGETVKIIFKNTGKLPHNFTITELGIATKTISGGQQDSVIVTAEKGGTYNSFCSVGNHRVRGMEGKFTVK